MSNSSLMNKRFYVNLPWALTQNRVYLCMVHLPFFSEFFQQKIIQNKVYEATSPQCSFSNISSLKFFGIENVIFTPKEIHCNHQVSESTEIQRNVWHQLPLKLFYSEHYSIQPANKLIQPKTIIHLTSNTIKELYAIQLSFLRIIFYM